MRAISFVAGIVIAGASFALLGRALITKAALDERDLICRPGYAASLRMPQRQSQEIKRDMFARISPMLCSMTWGKCSPDQYELDHIVPLCLGGPGDVPPNDPSNLEFQTLQEAREKGKIEVKVCRAYCSGKTTLQAARHFFASGEWRSVAKLKELLP